MASSVPPLPARLYDGQTARPWLVSPSLTDAALLLAPVDSVPPPPHLPLTWPLADLQLEAVGAIGFLGIRYGALALESTDETLNRALLRRLRVEGVGTRLAHWVGGGLVPLLGFVVVLVGLGLSLWWWGLPWAAARAVLLLPPTFDRELGRQAADGILRDERENQAATTALRHFGRAMQLDPSIRLHVLRAKEMNAFALPGGEVFVYQALADSLRTPGELAALLSHELAHVERRHGTQALARALAGYLVASALLGDANGVAAVMLDGAQQLGQLNYSRSLEAEADALGCQRLLALGYSPTAMADLFHRLDASTKSALEQRLEILSDHPNLQARIRYAEQLSRTRHPNHPPQPTLATAFAELQKAF